MSAKAVKNVIKKEVKHEAKKLVRKVAKQGGAKRKQALRAGRRIAHTDKGVPVRAITAAIGREQGVANRLAKAMSCPNMFPSFRIQDGYASLPTGCASPFMCIPGVFNDNDGSNVDELGVPADESWAIATRHPKCTLRYYNAGNNTYSYRAAVNGQNPESLFDAPANTPLEISYWKTNSDLSDTNKNVHGTKMATGFKAGGNGGYKYTLGQDNQTLNLSGLAESTSCKFTVTVLIGEDEWIYTRTQTTTAGGTMSATFSDFVCVDDAGPTLPHIFHWTNFICSLAVSDGALDFLDTGGPVLCQLMLADFEDVEDVFDVMRFNALNLMYSNTAAQLDKSGFCAGWQVPKNHDWIQVIQKGFEWLANRPNAARMVVDDGIHGFWKSTAASDWTYDNVGDSEESDGCESSYPLYSNSDTLMVCLKLPRVLGRAGYWTIFSATEERHDSVWFGEGFPNHSRVEFERALEIQARVPQWHCNPFHIKDIFNFISRNRERIKKTGQLINHATGYRSAPIIEPLSQLLDTWFG